MLEKLTFFIVPYRYQLLLCHVPTSPSGEILLLSLSRWDSTSPWRMEKSHRRGSVLPSQLFSHLTFASGLVHLWVPRAEHSSWHTVDLLNVCWMASENIQRNVFGNCGQNHSPFDVLNGVLGYLTKCNANLLQACIQGPLTVMLHSM